MNVTSALVVGDLAEEGLHPVSQELASHAASLGLAVTGLVVGKGAEAGARQMASSGASRVLFVEAPALAGCVPGLAVGHAVKKACDELHPDVVLFGATYNGRDAAGAAAVLLGRPVVANVIDIDFTHGARAVSTIFGATQKVVTELTAPDSNLLLIRAKSFPAVEGTSASGTVEAFSVEFPDWTVAAKVGERTVEGGSTVKLEDAPVVVSGGRGLQDAKNFALVEELAHLLKGAPGASRAIVDAGWVPYALQVGQTGKTVKPTVYIACGISGAMQHTVGMKSAQYIIAINKDEGAPIFKLADLGVVGDVLDILPRVIDALKSRSN